jgi:hypothetical protein
LPSSATQTREREREREEEEEEEEEEESSSFLEVWASIFKEGELFTLILTYYGIIM